MKRILATTFIVFLFFTGSVRADDVDFSREIQPILARSCFPCHGPDEEVRRADLRLDRREVAVEMGAVVPGKPEQSELVRRIFANDPDERMPPADATGSLTDEQKQLIRRWIAEGAKYNQHWAFVPPRRPEIPAVQDRSWPRNAIDYFILSRLETEGLQPSTEADRYTLVRRLYLDLIGLPPTPEQADAFAKDRDPQAYEKLVESLLQSERYGERWARRWLDLARYADTNGYEKDRPRSIRPYRDWVIDALNDDVPFDRFTIEQLAGDMLPDASTDSRIATGFHRNTMLNEEGGIDPLEYRFYAMVDRVATTGTVWMGMTLGCAQCHSHKYDPISHTDYYRMMALLNNADEPDLIVPDADVAKRRQKIEGQIEQLVSELPNRFPPAAGDGSLEERRKRHLEAKFEEWLASQRARTVPWTTLRPFQMESNLPRLELLDDGSIFSTGDITKRDVFTLRFHVGNFQKPLTALQLEVLPDDRLPDGGPGRAYYEGRKGDFFLSEVTAAANGKPVGFASASHSYGKISIGSGSADAENVIDGKGSTGWSTSGGEGKPHQLVLNLAQPLKDANELEIKLLFERHFAAGLGRFRFSATTAEQKAEAKGLPVELSALLVKDPNRLSDSDRQKLMRYYLTVAPELSDARKKIDQLRNQLPDFPTTMVMQERPADNPRKTFLHHRGEYLQAREEVTGAVPGIFPQLPDEATADRLTLARWLVSERNPLVGRVTVNRAWRTFFGTGLVSTSGDFGVQSNSPSHPELLDWLACEFVEQGWSLKKLHRLIVTSATYRQSSELTPELVRRDPGNRLLSRGPRFRVDAEMVRDIMLQSSGLLSTRIGGPSVYPPQPAGVTALAYGNTKWIPSTGEDRYRRSLYTFSKRTAPFAAYAVFDAPTGENCIAKRERSNTPLQALTLLNDEMFLEAARAAAKQALKQQPASAEQTAAYIFRRFLTRPPTPQEMEALLEFQQAQRKRLNEGKLNAAEIGGDERATAELAAWVMVARVIMNLDETITKQ